MYESEGAWERERLVPALVPVLFGRGRIIGSGEDDDWPRCREVGGLHYDRDRHDLDFVLGGEVSSWR